AKFVLCAILGLGDSIAGQAVRTLPAPVSSALDQMHPAWGVAGVSEDVRTAVGAHLGPTPNVIVGDFDGDGRRDVAVLIEYRSVDQSNRSFTDYSEVIAFLDTRHGYEPIRLGDRIPEPDHERYLTLQKRGAQGYDFEANKKFSYPHDSIGLWFFGK